MAAAKAKLLEILGNKENVVSLLLLGSFVALGVRSSVQQREIEALEAEKKSLRSGNRAMSTALWESRQQLFSLAESNPSAAPVPLARLRAIFGEDAAIAPHDATIPGLGVNVAEDSTPIA